MVLFRINQHKVIFDDKGKKLGNLFVIVNWNVVNFYGRKKMII